MNNQPGRKAFIAIHANDLETFKQLITTPTFNLLITDHCHSALQNDLGGTWLNKGLWENNTLLNLALSLERLDFVEELIKQNKTGRDIGLSSANNVGISPLHMALMVGCNKPGDDPELRIVQLRRILPTLWDKSFPCVKYESGDAGVGSAVSKLYHLPAIVAMDVLNLCRGDLVMPTCKENIKLAIREMILQITNPHARDAQITNIMAFISLMKQDRDYEILLDQVLIEPPQGVKTPYICTLLDNGYRPIPYEGQLGYVPANESTLALITPAIYAHRDTLINARGQKLEILLSSDFPDPIKARRAPTGSFGQFFAESAPPVTSSANAARQENDPPELPLKNGKSL